MAIAFVAASAVVTGNSPIVAIPAGYAEGNLLVLVTTGNNTPNTPTGWTQRFASGTGRFITIFTKYAGSTESSVGLSGGLGSIGKAAMLCYSGAGSYDVVGSANGATSTTATTSSQTTTYANDYVISIFARATTASTFTNPAGTNTRVNSSSTATENGLLIADELKATAGATTARSTTLSVSGAWGAINISFVETRTLYWVGGAGTWDTSTTGRWALSSAGSTTGIRPPVPNESVIIDGSSGTGTITCTAGECNDLTVTASQAITLGASSSTLSVYGNLSFPAGGSFSANTNANTITLAAGSSKTVTNNGKDFRSLTFNGVGGNWTLPSALTATVVTLTNGTITLSTNTTTFTCNTFSSSNGNTRAIAFGTGNITTISSGTVWNTANAANLTSTGTPTINISNNSATATTVSAGSSAGISSTNAFDFNFTTGSYALTLTAGSGVKALNFTGFTGTWSPGTGSYTLFGSLTLVSGMTFTTGTGTFSFFATSGTQTITSVGNTLSSIIQNGAGGTVALSGNLVSNGTYTLTAGTFNASNQNFTATNFLSNNSNSRTITMGSGTWTLTGTGTVWDCTTSTNLTVNANTSTIVLSDTSGTAKTFAGGSRTYNNLSITSATGIANYTITGGNTFNQISSSKTVRYSITLPSSVTTTVTTWGLSGSSLYNELILNSTVPGTQATLSVTNLFTCNYTYVSDNNLSTSNGTVTNGGLDNATGWTLGSGSTYFIILPKTSQSWTVPSNWDNSNNSIHIIGGGGGGAASSIGASTVSAGGGGGGGGYTKLVNQSYTPSQIIRYFCGNGGAGGWSLSPFTSSTGETGGTSYWGLSSAFPAFVSSQLSKQITASTTITVTVPSVSNGNLMIMIVNSSSNSATWTTPSGWNVGINNANGRAVFYRTASSEPANYVVTQSASNNATGTILVYSNAAWDTNGSNTALASSFAPVVSVSSILSTVIFCGFDDTASTIFSTPSGYTLREQDSDATAPSQTVFDISGISSGTYTSPVSTTQNTSLIFGYAFLIALSPTSTPTFTISASGGSGGTSTSTGTPSSTGGAGGTGTGGSINFTGGNGGAGGVSTGNSNGRCGGGGGGGGAGVYGNGGNGGAGANVLSPNNPGSGGGGGNGGGSAGGNASGTTNGTGGNNFQGTGGASSSVSSELGGGGSGTGTGSASTGNGSNGVDILIIGSGVGSGGGSGGRFGSNTNSAGLYGGGGGGGGGNTSTSQTGANGAIGGIVIFWGTLAASGGGNYFLLF